MEKEILERANKGKNEQICDAIGAGLGRIDQTGVTVTSGQSSYAGRGGSLLSFRDCNRGLQDLLNIKASSLLMLNFRRRGNSRKNTNYILNTAKVSKPQLLYCVRIQAVKALWNVSACRLISSFSEAKGAQLQGNEPPDLLSRACACSITGNSEHGIY